jgi:hypothetical protein
VSSQPPTATARKMRTDPMLEIVEQPLPLRVG